MIFLLLANFGQDTGSEQPFQSCTMLAMTQIVCRQVTHSTFLKSYVEFRALGRKYTNKATQMWLMTDQSEAVHA
jgi:hypothetical protein